MNFNKKTSKNLTLLAVYVKKLNQQVLSIIEYINRTESLKQSSDIKL